MCAMFDTHAILLWLWNKRLHILAAWSVSFSAHLISMYKGNIGFFILITHESMRLENLIQRSNNDFKILKWLIKIVYLYPYNISLHTVLTIQRFWWDKLQHHLVLLHWKWKWLFLWQINFSRSDEDDFQGYGFVVCGKEESPSKCFTETTVHKMVRSAMLRCAIRVFSSWALVTNDNLGSLSLYESG